MDPPDKRSGNPADAAEQSEMRDHLNGAVANLADPIREVVVLHYSGGLSLRETAEAHAREFLAALAIGGAALQPKLVASEPMEAILRELQSGDHDLVVMGTHGRTGLARVALGSVAERVLRRADRPVMTVRAPELGAERVTAAEPTALAP